jgi:hypothetical protein
MRPCRCGTDPRYAKSGYAPGLSGRAVHRRLSGRLGVDVSQSTFRFQQISSISSTFLVGQICTTHSISTGWAARMAVLTISPWHFRLSRENATRGGERDPSGATNLFGDDRFQ